jgi:DNA repair photolyase
MKKPISGTKEWSVASVNCLTGCEHACRYCYAREQALRFKRIATAADWQDTAIRAAEVWKKRKKYDGRVMFPTTHDITPTYLEPCRRVLENLLLAGNDVLIVTKANAHCVNTLCLVLAHGGRKSSGGLPSGP